MPLSGGTRFYPPIERRGFGGVIELLEAADRLEQFENSLRFLFIDPREGEADMDQNVITDLRFRNVLQANLFADAAKLHLRHPDRMLVMRLEYFPRNGETHKPLASALQSAAGKRRSTRSGFPSFPRSSEKRGNQGGQREASH